jgi:flagellar M-ring protein FliF
MVQRDSVLPPQDMMTKLQANPKPVVAIAALIVLLVIALVSVSALKPKKSQAIADGGPNLLPPISGYPELPAGTQMRSAMQGTNDYDDQELDEPKRPVRLPPPPTTLEREQAMATVDQRPDAAVRVMRGWLRS